MGFSTHNEEHMMPFTKLFYFSNTPSNSWDMTFQIWMHCMFTVTVFSVQKCKTRGFIAPIIKCICELPSPHRHSSFLYLMTSPNTFLKKIHLGQACACEIWPGNLKMQMYMVSCTVPANSPSPLPMGNELKLRLVETYHFNSLIILITSFTFYSLCLLLLFLLNIWLIVIKTFGGKYWTYCSVGFSKYMMW